MSAERDYPRQMSLARHDIEDLYRLQAELASGQRQLAERVGVVQQTLDLHTGRLDRLEENQLVQTTRLDGIDGRLDGIDGRLDGIDGRLDRMDGRFDGMEGRQNGTDGRLDRIEGQLTEVLEILRVGRG